MKDIVLSINTVEAPLLGAVRRLSKELGRSLSGLVLVDKNYADKPERAQDTSGLFTEIVCDFYNSAELQRALKPYIDRLLVVTCRLEGAIPSLRQAIPFLPYLDTPSETSLLWSTDKSMMRDRLSTYDRSLAPRYQYLESTDLPHVRDLVRDFTFPVIVKPTNLAKSLLVSDCSTMEELESCLQETFEIIHEVYAKERRRTTPSVLVEEMMQGAMYSTDAYVTKNGDVYCLPLVRVWTANDVGLPGFYGFRIQAPVELPQSEIDQAFQVSTNAVKALNLRSTTTHIELFQTAQGWKIIEVGARIGGYRETLYREAYGIEHFYNDLLVRMGRKPEMPGKPIRHATGLNIYADEEGIITAIDGLQEARKLESVVFIEKHAQPGDLALFASEGGDLIVDAILSNKDPEQLEKDVQSLLRLVRIRVKQPKTQAAIKRRPALVS